ncbi:DUF2637 domain-containing protein [Streptomyces phytohabitans]|uniref:DUF2637 domain-containing protein n=1 Tax=Streptomyces phytohabitans TaxID=1150371 RepID=UPI00345BA7FD
MQAVQLTRTHRILIGVVVSGAVVIAGIGFAGSYAAVRDLAEKKGFGDFAPFFPIGIDAGIVVLLALDLLLTWIRIPFPLLRQTAWLLTAATIAFNGAAAWPDPLGVGMHAVIPVLFVVAVEAARHAVGRIADITADKHMEGVRVSRWLLAFPSTFRLWRRMKLWELRSYDQVIRMEQDRLVYEARLHARYGRGWRRKAPVESLMPLRLARYGVPLAETGPAGLAAAGIKPPVLLPGSGAGTAAGALGAAAGEGERTSRDGESAVREPEAADVRDPAPEAADTAGVGDADGPARPPAGASGPRHAAQPTRGPGLHEPAPDPAYAAEAYTAEAYAPTGGTPRVTVPVGPGRVRALGNANAPLNGAATHGAYAPVDAPPVEGAPRERDGLFLEPQLPAQRAESYGPAPEPVPAPEPRPEPEPVPVADPAETEPVGIPDGVTREDFYFQAYRDYAAARSDFPNARQLAIALNESHGVTDAHGNLLSEAYLRTYLHEIRERYRTEMGMAG